MSSHDLDRLSRDLGESLEPDDAQALALVAARLDVERPVPAAGFRGRLGRQLARPGSDLGRSRPPRLAALVAGWAALGVALLAVAALGLAGAGPLAAQPMTDRGEAGRLGGTTGQLSLTSTVLALDEPLAKLT